MSERGKNTSVYEALLEEIAAIPVIDAHEHLPAEGEYLKAPTDALSLYGQYTRLPMFASGLSEDDWERMHDPTVPVLQRWRLAKPHISNIKHTSFARAAQVTMEHFWGVAELADDNVEALSEKISAQHKPGVYRNVLADHCGIRCVLNQDTSTDYTDGLNAYLGQELLAPVVALVAVEPPDNICIARIGGEDGFTSLDDYLDWARGRLKTLAADGAVAFKTTALPYDVPDRRRAAAGLKACAGSKDSAPRSDEPGPMLSYVHDELLKTAGSLGLTVAVHTGFWGDFRKLNPTHMIPVIERHGDVHFDLFHLGIPFARETGSMAANFANVSVNMCWAHSINAAMTRSALDEYIDGLGADKIIAFGGDVRWFVHKVYGHLELARRNVASVLARRIRQDLLDADEARALAKAWFFENPKRIYGLQSQGT